MRQINKVSVWVQQNYDAFFMVSLCALPFAIQVFGAGDAALFQLVYLSSLSALMLHAKVFKLRALRVPQTETLWLLTLLCCLVGLTFSVVQPETAFLVLCAVMPLTMWTLLQERRHRYQIARNRIRRRRGQLERWRDAKRAVLKDWKDRLRWMAGVQHDMRQPLHALGLLMAHPCFKPGSSNETTQGVVVQMTSCQRWLHDLADNILEATRLELGEQRAMRIESVTSESVRLTLDGWMRQMALNKGLEFVLDVEEGVMQTDSRRLKRVLGNLVFNAIEHTFEGGVYVMYRRRRGVHQFTVSDTGPGLDPALMDLNPQNCALMSDLPKTGIGLYVVKRLCQEMNWLMRLDNQTDRGTRFVLEIADRIPANAESGGGHAIASKPQPGQAVGA